MAVNKWIAVEVAYATPLSQRILSIQVPAACTVLEAITQSGMLTIFPEIDLGQQKVGIFSKACALTDTLSAGDRIEIYRPLKIDPKDARRAKAKKR